MIIRNIVGDVAEIKKILTVLCGENPLTCDKQNVSGILNNKRVIVVRGQYFEYYNTPPKFKNGDMSTLDETQFKAKVKLTDIYQIQFIPQNSMTKKGMKLSIPLNLVIAKNIEEYKSKVSNASSLPFSSNDNVSDTRIIQWIFFFGYDVRAQITKRIYEEEQRQNYQLYNIEKYDPDDEDQEHSADFYHEEKQVKKELPVNVKQELDKNLQKLKQVKQYLQFKQKLQKQEQDRQNMIKLSLSLRKKQGETPQENQQQIQHEIYPIRQAWKDFWKAYEKASKCIGQQVTKQYLERQLAVLYEIYKIQMQARVIFQQYINFKLVGWAPDRVFHEEFEFYKGIWIKMGDKQLNQQFLSNYYLSDLMYVLKTINKMKFRIGPMFLMNYKGLKAIIRIDLPFNTIKHLSHEVYSVRAKTSSIDTQLLNNIKDALTMLQKILNIKSQNFGSGNFETSAPLGHDIKVYQYHSKYEESSMTYLQNFFYIVDIKGLFPVDYQFQLKGSHPDYCLRPELISEYRDFMESTHSQDYQLLTQSFKVSDIHLDLKQKQDKKVMQVSLDFIPMKIKQLMNQFNQVNIIMVDSYSIKQYMSEMGINSRYLGQMYHHTEIPYILETLQIQMLARIVKNIYCESIKDLVSNPSFFKREMYLRKHKQAFLETMRIHNDLMTQNAIDFLNLVFGVGIQTNQFWKIVMKRCHQKYNISFEFPLKCKIGCLLHAVLWHCKFVVGFQLDIKLFAVEKPFEIRKNWIDFRLQSKSFDFPSFELTKVIKKLAIIDDKSTQQMQKHIISLLKIQLLHHNTAFGLDFRTQITLSKLNNKMANLQKPLRECSYHPSELPYYFENKTHQNFKKALDIINFSLASNHPLFISLYDVYSQQFEPELLKKSTLLAAIKGLGEFHPRTTQLYSKYYRQGFEEFQVKAKRSEQTQAALTISEQLFNKGKYETCMNFCFARIQKRQSQKRSAKSNDLTMYLSILKYGILSSVKTRFFKKGLVIAEEYSQMINTYKIRTYEDHELILQKALIIRLHLSNMKFYLYKMVLLVLKIQQQFEPGLPVDKFNLKLPRGKVERQKILIAIMNQYYLEQTHSKWIQYIFKTLKRGYLYFNYLSDLFNNYKYHIQNYGMPEFQNALGYLDVLVRFFGQKLFYDCLYQVV